MWLPNLIALSNCRSQAGKLPSARKPLLTLVPVKSIVNGIKGGIKGLLGCPVGILTGSPRANLASPSSVTFGQLIKKYAATGSKCKRPT